MKYSKFLLLTLTLATLDAAAIVVSERDLLPLLMPRDAVTESASLVASGVVALQAGDLNHAESLFKRAISANAKDPMPLLGLAKVAARRERPQEVKAYLDQAQRVDRDSPEVYTSLGRFYLTQGQPTEAEAAYKKARLLNPDAVTAVLDLGFLYLNELRRNRSALETFESALELQPQNPKAHYGHGLALANEKEYGGAVAAFEKVTELLPNDPTGYQSLGRLFRSQQQNEKALAALTRGISANENYAPLLMERADLHFAVRDVQSAMQDYRKVATLLPDSPVAHFRLGMLNEVSGKSDAALAAYQRAIAADSDHIEAHNNFAWLTLQSGGDLALALKHASRAVTLSEDAPVYLDTLAWVQRGMGNLKEAEETLERAVRRDTSDNATIHYHLGVVRSELGSKRRAVRSLNKALKLNAEFPEADDARRRLQQLTNS